MPREVSKMKGACRLKLPLRAGVVCVIVFLSLLSLAYSQDTIWTRIYGGEDDDEGNAVIEVSTGGYLIAGVTESYGAGDYDVYLVRTDEDGETLWTRTYGGADYDWGSSVIEVSAGGFLIAGGTCSFGTGNPLIYLVRTDENGDTLWTRTYEGACGDGRYSVIEVSTGGFLLAGGGCLDSYKAYMIRLDENGDTLWTRAYSGVYFASANSAVEVSSGGFLVVGSTGFYDSDVYLIRTDENGDTLWTRTYGGSDSEEGYSVIEVSTGGFLVAGYTRSFGAGSYDFYLLRIDENGDTLWTRTYGGSDLDICNSLVEVSLRGFLLAGRTESYGAGWADVYLVRINENGDTLWTRTYGDNGFDEGRSVIEVSSWGYLVAGCIDGEDIYLLRICQYMCGDVNGNGEVNPADLCSLGSYLYAGGQPPVVMWAADVNGDGTVAIADLYYLAYWLLSGGPPLNCR